MYKNQLQELAQRSCFNLPSYSCIREGPDHVPRFQATVNFNGETFESPTFCSTLRQAEHAAAEVALNTLAKRGPSRALAAKVLDETGVYKNLLQETAHRAGLNLPVYTTVRSGPGLVPVFACTVELAGMSFTGEPARTKKRAQKNAAMAAWSALKRLSQHGSSSTNSSSFPLSETKGNEEQEQVIIARVLASLQPSQLKHSLQTDCQHGQQSSIPVCRDLTSPTPRLYPMHCEHWAYPTFYPGLSMYQMWQQEQLLLLQNHLLAIPVSPACPPSPQILPYMQSIFCPDHSPFVPEREQNPLPAGPRFTVPTSGPSLYFSNYSVSDRVRGKSTVTIQEIHETEESSGFSPSVITDAPVTGHANAEPRIEEPVQEDDKQKNVQLESKVENFQLEGNQTGQYECASHRNLDSSSRPVDFHLENQRSLYCSQPNLRPQHPPRASSNRSFRPPSAAAVPMMVRNMGPIFSAGHRPQNVATCMPAPARPGIPSCSARPRLERMNIGRVHPNFMAPAVRIRSVVPVCSAPPTRKISSAIQEGFAAEKERKIQYQKARQQQVQSLTSFNNE